MKILRLALAASALSLLAPAMPDAGTPKNALGAIAVAPNGQWVLAAGDNLTLYVIDAATLAVQSRHWIGVNPDQLAFSADGSTLAVIDIDVGITFLDATTFQPRSNVGGFRTAAVLAGADQIVAMTNPSRKDGKTTTDIVVYAIADGREVMRVTADAEGTAVGGSPDGSILALLTRATDTTAETRTQPPEDKKGLDRDIFEQQNDGKASEMLVFDAKGQMTARHPLWFSTTANPAMAILNGQIHVLPFDNENLRVDAVSGNAELYKFGSSLTYGLGLSADHGTLVTGSLADGVFGTTGGTPAEFEVDGVGSWPEYFKGFAFAPDGTMYGGTTAYRLVRIGPDGTVAAAAPIF
jgi:hypothetical protein